MRNKTNSRIFMNLKRRLVALLAFILMLIGLIVFLAHINAKSQRETSVLLETLSKQRLYTQKISKEAMGIALNYERLKRETQPDKRMALEGEIRYMKAGLGQANQSFQVLLNQTNYRQLKTVDGSLKIDREMGSDYDANLSLLNANWVLYESATKRVLTQPSDSANFQQALSVMDELDDQLIKNCEAISLEIEKYLDKRYNSFQGITLLVIILLLVITGLTLYEFYKYLFMPLEALYDGFSEMGITDAKDYEEKSGIDQVVMEVELLFSRMRQIMHLMEQISLSASFEDSLKNIYETFKDYIPYTYIGIALYKGGEDGQLVASYGVSGTKHKDLANQLLGLTVKVDETSLGKILEHGTPRMINDYERYFESRKIKSYSRILLDNGIRASITVPLKVNQKSLGFIFFSSDTKNVYQPKHIKFLEMVGDAIAVSFEKNIYVDDLLYSSVLALAKLAEARDEDTGAHLTRMKNYALHLTKLMKNHPEFKNQINPQFLIDIEKFSPMHDIGKVGVNDSILLKPGKLTAEEFDSMKYHTIFGANVLREAENNLNQNNRSLFRMGIEIASAHHEKWDGSGYPNGLVGDQIPLAARIVALADVLDALLSVRPYKQAFSFEKACEIIQAGRGVHFDPRIVDVFFEHLDDFRFMNQSNLISKV